MLRKQESNFEEEIKFNNELREDYNRWDAMRADTMQKMRHLDWGREEIKDLLA